MAETGITREPGSALPPPGPPPAGEHADGPANPDVRYEPTDVAPRGVVIFLAALAVMLIALGAILAGYFFLLEHRAEAAKRPDLPLAVSDQDRLPDAPRIEGILPAEDAGRAFANSMEVDGPVTWQGYNVRLVPPPEDPLEQIPDPVQRNMLGREKLERQLSQIDADIPEVAKRLPVRKGARPMPVDTFRRSLGEASSGRLAGEGAP
jgi:hypothetical protein